MHDYSVEKNKKIYNMSVNSLFEDRVKEHPNKAAIVYKNQTYTFFDLNCCANQLARYLLHNNIAPKSIVAIMTDYTPDMVIGILAIIKIGCAYLPIDINYPPKRIEYILSDSKVKYLLTDNTQKMYIDNVKCIDMNSHYVREQSGQDLDNINHWDDLLYTIYTSGSTGEPKGVMIEHKGIINYFMWRQREYKLSHRDVILQTLSFSFDGFGANLYSSLLAGGTLIIPEQEARLNYKKLVSCINDTGVTHLSIIPSMYEAIICSAESDDMKSLRLVVLAGYETNKAIIRESKNKFPNVQLVNEYGPTENTIASTAYLHLDVETSNVIGKPIDHIQAYVVGADNKILAEHITGELYLSGIALARGYLNNPELTNSKFLPNPNVPGEIWYKTGDLVQWDENGNLVYIGNIENQVKIRGNRLVLQEVERKILESGLVKNTVVIEYEYKRDNLLLVAYVVWENKEDKSALRKYLNEWLPSYAIPTIIESIEFLPITPNGKPDRNMLPPLKLNLDSTEEPQNDIEKIVINTFKEVIGINEITLDGDYFEIGADSLNLMDVLYKLDEKYPDILSIIDLFKYKTIRLLSKYIEERLQIAN